MIGVAAVIMLAALLGALSIRKHFRAKLQEGLPAAASEQGAGRAEGKQQKTMPAKKASTQP